MMQLILHAEHLLSIHECVIIPGLGGFVGRLSPARFDEINSTWTPPRKEIGFNSGLFHNDGLLLNSYVNTYSISYSEAFVMVEKAVLELKKELCTKKQIQFGRIGSLNYDENGALLFAPADDLLYFSARTFGLFPIKIPLLNELKETHQAIDDEPVPVSENEVTKIPIESTPAWNTNTSADTIYIPLRKKTLYRIAAVAVIILIFLFLSTPIYVDTTHKTNFAKLLAPNLSNVNNSPEESDFFISKSDIYIPQPSLGETIIPSKPEAKNETVSASANDNTQENIAGADKTSSTDKVSEKPANTETVTSVQKQEVVSGRYYIIIGSFPSEKIAQQFLNETKRTTSLPNARTMKSKSGKNYRVSATDFENLSEANRFLNDFRNRYKQHTGAWVYFDK